MRVENYVEGAVSFIVKYKEYEDYFYNWMIAFLMAFFFGWCIWFFSRYAGALLMVMSLFFFMLSTVCWGFIKVVRGITTKVKLMGEKVGTSDIR